jgi:hypothetical protein
MPGDLDNVNVTIVPFQLGKAADAQRLPAPPSPRSAPPSTNPAAPSRY